MAIQTPVPHQKKKKKKKNPQPMAGHSDECLSSHLHKEAQVGSSWSRLAWA
jgi:hypothetical protein